MKLLEWLLERIPKNHIYLSGPMTGIPEHNRPLFNVKAQELREAGYKVINPADFKDHSWVICLTRDLIFMLLFCRKIATLPGWKKSNGGNLENYVGNKLKYKRHTVEYWLYK